MKGAPPVPPRELIHLVSGHQDAAKFLRGGLTASQAIRDTLRKNGVNIEELGTILDFGCGIGRIMRYWKNLRCPTLHGTDYNPKLIEWCKRNLGFADFQVNALSGKLHYPSETFDFIYAFSVFTHLSEPLQFHWIEELYDALRPGGYLYLTTHGEFYFSALTTEQRARLRAGRMVILEETRAGTNHCLVYHPEEFVRGKLAVSFVVADFVQRGAMGNSEQDVYLLRKPRAGC
jgi:SAM-dependent methyltransferase